MTVFEGTGPWPTKKKPIGKIISYPTYKTPETWLTRRRGYMERLYSGMPMGGFSGTLGLAATQRKKLLGK